MPSGKYSPYPSLSKLLFGTDKDLYRKPQRIKLQSCGTQFQCIHLQNKSYTYGFRKYCKRGEPEYKTAFYEIVY